jgi:alkanesulfonate monooxygenase SsuD/methylene tetrahydromethanopterin reductase-like flavin-dependent oxidoreductase (luciferase family)
MTRARQAHLGVMFPGVDNATVWSRNDSGSQIDFSSFQYLAQAAEQAKFDLFFLAEGLRMVEINSQIADHDIAGRPDSLTQLAALSVETERIGLVATLNATFNEPLDFVNKVASLAALSEGRAAWNIVTTLDTFVAENFKLGAFVDYPDRYRRAHELYDLAQALWTSAGLPVPSSVSHSGKFFEFEGFPAVQLPREHRPVIVQSGDSDSGRDFGVGVADVIFSRFAEHAPALDFTQDIRRRYAAAGRDPETVRVVPDVCVVLGDTETEAKANAELLKQQQITGRGAIRFLESVWGRDLSDFDPNGPVPDVEPDFGSGAAGGFTVTRQRLVQQKVGAWRELAATDKLSIRELVMRVGVHNRSFVGTAEQIADTIEHWITTGASDGFVLVPQVIPTGLDEFFDRVVPLLQARGVFREGYEGSTLRSHLGLEEGDAGC